LIAIIAVAAVTIGTVGLGGLGMRLARTTSDLLVASRSVTAWWNAAAISGEYLSAASFLGIAGLEMQDGTTALWQSLGFTAGYLALLLFVAAPLRRFGSYTIPDFAEARLRSPGLRGLASVGVLLIAGFYLVPQLKGAGLTLGVVTGAPYFVGVLAVGLVVALNVGLGGMRGIHLRAGRSVLDQAVRDRTPGLPAADPSRWPAGARGAVWRSAAERGSARARSQAQRAAAGHLPRGHNL
jgi:Na+(H+)/acetate symporter ActP